MKKTFLNISCGMLLLGAVGMSSPATAQQDNTIQQEETIQEETIQEETLQQEEIMQEETMQADVADQQASSIIESWPEKSNEVAHKMIEKYGEPDETTSSMLIWHDSGDWKRTIVYKEPVEHKFPMPHKDVLEQTINYQLDVDKYSDIAKYDGSVFAERTKGELSARCDAEEANFLAINLAYDIEQGNKTVEEARKFYSETIKAFKNGESSKYIEGFIFELPEGEATDPGKPVE